MIICAFFFLFFASSFYWTDIGVLLQPCVFCHRTYFLFFLKLFAYTQFIFMWCTIIKMSILIL
uniref:Lycopene epsilon cyclase n=1 Tax=Rhizophora mucronata TaxID=61149 RepID=A0A2P2MIA3_RHIMU